MPIRADSTEYRTATITADKDITGDTIEVALPATGQSPASWFAAEVLGVDQVGALWKATYRVLIGPAGTIQLTAGSYDWIVRITDDPEIPVVKAPTAFVVTAS